MKITHNKTYNYFIELSETVNLDEYSSIVIRYKTTSASTYLYACDEKTGGNSIDVNSLAGSSVATGADGDYVEVDILSALKAKTDTLKWVKTWCNDASGGDIYIDSITFTKNPA